MKAEGSRSQYANAAWETASFLLVNYVLQSHKPEATIIYISSWRKSLRMKPVLQGEAEHRG